MAADRLVVNVVELVRAPAQRRHVSVTAPLEAIAVAEARIADGTEAHVELDLESLSDGIVVSGLIAAPFLATCRRCLGPVAGQVQAQVRELYQRRPTSDDAYPFDGELLDLGPLVREAVALELPLAPLCREECPGLCPVCGADRNEHDCGHQPDTSDPRWAALEALRDQLSQPPVADT